MSTILSANHGESTAGWIASADFLSALLRQITQPFVVTDGRGRLLLWNQAFEDLSGYGAAELPALNYSTLFSATLSPSEPGARELPLGESAATAPPETFLRELRAKDRDAIPGEGIPVQLNAIWLHSPSGEALRLILLTNLSERHRLEAELRQSQKMEAIGRLAGGIAHDFNNVLTTILGLTESMISGRMAPSAESLREIHHSAAHAAELTRNLLAFGRRQILQMKSIRLDEVMANMTKMVARLIGEDIRLEISADEHLPAIRADQSQVEQVLLNLCLNARDAMPKGGELRVRVRSKIVGEETSGEQGHSKDEEWSGKNDEWSRKHQHARPGTYVLLSVQDTGEGMDEETLRQVFEPFFTRKAVGKGTGLGLSMVYGIIQQHEGFIQVTSEVGAGSEFTIFFPASSAEPELVLPGEIAVADADCSATVLVVEDEKSVRRLVLEVLSKLGYRTFAAANGEEAVKVFERWHEQIDLVLLDAILPKKGAREVYEQIRLRKPSVRFVFTSGYNEVFINKKFEWAPSFPFLRKPFTTLELATMIRSALATELPKTIL